MTESSGRPVGTAGTSQCSAASSTTRSTCAVRSAGAVSASPVAMKLCWIGFWSALKRRFPAVVITNPYRFGYFVDENLPIPNFAGSRGVAQRLDHLFKPAVGNHQLDLRFGQQVHIIFLSPVHFLVPLLAAMAAHFGDGHAIDPDALQRLLHLVELEGLDDGFDFLHFLIVIHCTGR